MTRRAVAVCAVLLGAGALAGCGNDSAAAITSAPLCPVSGGDAGNGVVLMAQSVPTATWVPCVRTALPEGWGFNRLEARDGGSRFWLNSDRDGTQAVEVRLQATCDISGSTEIASDRDGMRRYERVRRVSPTYAGERLYRFPGGCLSVVFRLGGDNPGEALALASQAVGAVNRDDLNAQVHRGSGGQIQLDPNRGDG